MQQENYAKFIADQKDYFEKNLYKDGDMKWSDEHWLKTGKGSSWLLSRIRTTSINFSIITKTKGIPNGTIDKEYQEFCKAMLIYSYRQANSKASVQKLSSELLMLKRWYYSLKELTDTTDPINITTEILNHAFELMKEHTNPNNLSDHAGTFKRLQEIVNTFGFTKQKLEFDVDIKYLCKQNRTPKARVTKELIESLNIDENELNAQKLISIQTFINIASLRNLCQSDGEKILVNFLFLTIITGFRSTETIMLKKDCLIERPLLDPMTQNPIILNGKPQTILGIKYYGAKGAGERIHWVEPSSANLVRSIFKNTLEITEPYRQHLLYLKHKQLKNLLPKTIDAIEYDPIEVDDFIDEIFTLKDSNLLRAFKRRKLISAFKNANIQPIKEVEYGNSVLKYYSKSSINDYIRSQAEYDKENPITQIFNYEGRLLEIPFDDLLFIHEFRSATLSQALINKTNIIPLRHTIINNFLGAGNALSVFEKYELKDDEDNISKLSSHIPRHNINTFLAISDVADHLQAMLMGRVDIEQNKYYQHLTIKQISQNASLNSNIRKNVETQLVSPQQRQNTLQEVKKPIDALLDFGAMLFDSDKNLDTNLRNNLHTFDDKSEIADFIQNTLDEGYFDDIARAFDDLAKTDTEKAKELIDTHAYLHPLPFGSCMRDISAHGCPKRLACQSGESCVNFTLTGRLGELENLTNSKNRLIEQASKIDGSTVFGQKLNKQIENLVQHERNLIKSLEQRIPISIVSTNDTELDQAKTLAQLFAYEHEKLENLASEEQNA